LFLPPTTENPQHVFFRKGEFQPVLKLFLSIKPMANLLLLRGEILSVRNTFYPPGVQLFHVSLGALLSVCEHLFLYSPVVTFYLLSSPSRSLRYAVQQATPTGPVALSINLRKRMWLPAESWSSLPHETNYLSFLAFSPLSSNLLKNYIRFSFLQSCQLVYSYEFTSDPTGCSLIFRDGLLEEMSSLRTIVY